MSDGEGLLGWLQRAGIVGGSDLAGLRRLGAGVLDEVAAEATALREWFRSFLKEREGQRLTAVDLPALDTLNRVLARDTGVEQVVGREADPDGSSLFLEHVYDWDRPDRILQPVARAIAALVCSDETSVIRTCSGPTCTLMFVDRTKSHRRRWCSMAVCGNRAKAAAHRARASRGE